MEFNANVMLGFKWVKKGDLQSKTKIIAQDDCLQKAKSSTSIAIDHCLNEVGYSRPHHINGYQKAQFNVMLMANHGYRRIYYNQSPQRAPQRRKQIRVERRHKK